MPAVLEFNAPAIRDRFASVAAYLGLAGGFEGFCDFVGTFNDLLEIPKTLGELGIESPALERLAEAALRDPSAGGNPVELTKAGLLSILERSL